MKGRYRYRARDHKGHLYRGIVEAVSREAAMERLLLDRLFIEELEETDEPPPAPTVPLKPLRPKLEPTPKPELHRGWRAALLVLALIFCGLGAREVLPDPAPRAPRTRLVVEGPLVGEGPLRFHFPELPLTVTRLRSRVGLPGRRFRLELLLETEHTPTFCRVEAEGAQPLELPVTSGSFEGLVPQWGWRQANDYRPVHTGPRVGSAGQAAGSGGAALRGS